MKKKMLALLMTCAMAVGMLAGCGANNTEAESSQSKESENTTNSTENQNDVDDPTDGGAGKTLVVYYSATGTTEGVAQTIAEVTGGDLFKLEPVTPYTDDDLNWTDDDSRVSIEHEDESQREIELVSTKVDNWDSYDKVYIGYPVWWGIAAWPVDGFVEANNFTGKTVIPFCTAVSSGIGDSGDLLEELAGTGNWIEGDRISRGASKDEVQEWLFQIQELHKQKTYR